MGELGFRKKESRGGRVRVTRQNQARALRQNATPAEERFWSLVRANRLGFKFRRQHQIGDWIVDFYCHEARLIIELDGGVHSGPDKDRKDATRQKGLESRGFHLIRFENSLVLVNPLHVEAEVRSALSLFLAPPPLGAGGAQPKAGRVGVEG